MKASLNSDKFEILLEVLVAALFFLTPLTFTLITRELFEFPKMILIYLLAVLFAYALFLSRGPRLQRPIPFLRPLSVLFLSYGFSTIFSSHLYTSLFGYYTRFNGGFLSIFSFLIIFFVLSQWLDYPKSSRIIHIIILSGVIICLYAFLQNLGFDKNFWVQDSQARTFSSLGQPNWLAAYLLLILPLPVYYYLNAANRWRQLLFLAISLLFYFALWSTYSLSGLLGLVFLVGGALFINRQAFWTHRRELLLLALLGLLASASRPGIFGAKLESFIKTIRPQVQIIETVLASGPKEEGQPKSIDTGDIRLSVWRGAVSLWLSQPKIFLIGAGPETFAYNFLPLRPKSLNQTSEWDFLYNKAHNYYLDLLTGVGLIGLFAYLFFVTIVFYKNWSFFRATPHSDHRPFTLPQLMLAGWISVLPTNFFGWPTVSLSLLFFVYPLLVNHLAAIPAGPDGEITRPAAGRVSLSRLAAASLILVVVLIRIINIFLADVSFSLGLAAAQSGQLTEAANQFRDAVSLNPEEPAYHKERAFILAQEASLAEPQKDGAALKEALREGEIAYQLNPNNSLTLRSLVRTYYLISRIDPSYTKRLEGLAQEIIELSPNEPLSHYDAALVFVFLEKKDEALQHLSSALALKSDYSAARELLDKLKSESLQ